MQSVQSRVDVPPVETRVAEVFAVGDGRLVELLVVRVHEFEVLQAFVLRHGAIADDLHLRLVRYRLQVRMQDASLCIERLAVPVSAGGRVEAVGQFVLGLGRAVLLAFQDHHLMAVQSGIDFEEIIV